MRSRFLLLLPSLALILGLTAPSTRAQTGPDQATELTTLGDLLDRIPNLAPFALPGFLPKGMRFYSSPHFGDLIHKDYMRVPVGVRVTNSPVLTSYVEVEGYFTHGLGDGSAGYGFDRLRTGFKYEPIPPPGTAHGVAWSTGLDFTSPLSRPPIELTDGYQHLAPYVAKSVMLAPDAKLIGFGSVGVDLLNHTALPSNFGENQLHSNAITASAGVVRDWRNFRGTLTFSYATTAIMSDESHQVFAIRPAVAFPLRRFSGRQARLLLALGAYSIWGPDGNELGLNTALRVDFIYARGGVKQP